MGAMSGNLDHTAELEAPSVRAGRFTESVKAGDTHLGCALRRCAKEDDLMNCPKDH